VSLSRQVTVRMPRPDSAPSGTGDWVGYRDAAAPPEPRLTWSPLAGRPLPSPSSVRAGGYADVPEQPTGHGRHRVRRSPGLRVAGFVLGLACLGAAFGGGWALGEQWAPDHGASIASQWQATVEGLRDWALGM